MLFPRNNLPNINSDGLNLVASNSQHARLTNVYLGGSMTFAVWVKVDSSVNNTRPFDFRNSNSVSHNQSLMLSMYDNKWIGYQSPSNNTTGNVSVGSE